MEKYIFGKAVEIPKNSEHKFQHPPSWRNFGLTADLSSRLLSELNHHPAAGIPLPPLVFLTQEAI